MKLCETQKNFQIVECESSQILFLFLRSWIYYLSSSPLHLKPAIFTIFPKSGRIRAATDCSMWMHHKKRI